MKVIISLDRDGLRVYADTDASIEVFDIAELRHDLEDDPHQLTKELKQVDKELLHKTTGLRQVYP